MLKLALFVTAATLTLGACDRQRQTQTPPTEPVGRSTPAPSIADADPAPTDNPTPAVVVAPTAPPAVAATKAPPRPEGDASTQDYDSLVRGKSLSELEGRYGKPAHIYTFKMGDGVPEFRIELLNTYAPDGTHDDVEILEHTYRLDGYKFTVWYHEKAKGWTGLEAVSYIDGVQF